MMAAASTEAESLLDEARAACRKEAEEVAKERRALRLFWRRAFVPVATLGLMLLLFSAMGATKEEEETLESATSAGDDDDAHPHLYLIVADDMGFGDIGYNSDPSLVNAVETPFLDSLAADGITLSRFYSQCDCTPARAALLSGRYPANTGMFHEVITAQSQWSLPREFTLIPSSLPESYRSHAIGKWDVGHARGADTPTERGFDSHLGYYGAEVEYDSHELSPSAACEGSKCLEAMDTCANGTIRDMNHDGASIQEEDRYSTYLFADHAAALVKAEASDWRLFLYLAFQAVHQPLAADAALVDRFSRAFLNESTGARATFAAVALELDRAVERFVAATKSYGAYEDAVFFFLSDNGATVGQAGGGSNWPLRGSKFTPYEGGVRVPAFVHSARLPSARRGVVHDGLFHVTDVLPTLASLASSPYPGGIDGVDQYDALWRGAKSPRHSALLHVDDLGYERDAMGFKVGAYVKGDYKIVVNATQASWCSPDSDKYRTEPHCWDLPTTFWADVHDGDGSYATYFNESFLFDVVSDPSERTDLKADLPDKYAELLADFHNETARMRETQYVADCTVAGDCDSLYETWIQNSACLVSPWLST